MKMRKKLAALLAAAMIASVMPMTAFAASTNGISQRVSVGKDGKTEKPQLQIEMKHDLNKNETFYLKLENAEWNEDRIKELEKDGKLTTGASIKLDGTNPTDAFEIKVSSKKELAVTAKTNFVKGDILTIDLVTKEIEKTAKVIVDPWDTAVSESEHIFAISTSANATVTVKEDDAPSFYTGKSKIAKFTIEEATAEALADHPKLKFELDNDDFEFVGGSVKYSKGFTGTDQPEFNVQKDTQVIEVDFSDVAGVKNKDRGVVEIELEVRSKATVRTPATGDLKATISSKKIDDKNLIGDDQTFKVGTIAEHGVELKADKTDYEFFAGRQEKVVFHLNEIVDDSIVDSRTTVFSLPEGVYFAQDADAITLKDGEKDGNIELIRNKDEQITGFEIDLLTNVKEKKVDKFKFEAKLDITSDFTGDVVLTAEGRSIGQDLEATIAKVKPAVKVTVESMTVQPGLKEQTGGKIVIEELEKGALQQGNILLALEEDSGIDITDADVKVVAGDLKINNINKGKTTKDAITFDVQRKSKEVSKIEITNVTVKLDRTVADGAYELKVGGSAISTLADKTITVGKEKVKLYGDDDITAKDFLFVGDQANKAAEVKFVIGSNKIIIDGKEVEMDAPAYIKDGRTMVPLRYLSLALGIDEEAIKFNQGVVTIFKADGKVIQLKNGDNNLMINGMAIPMTAAAEIVEGRTYVPVTEIGSVFGVTGTWDADTQTATFK